MFYNKSSEFKSTSPKMFSKLQKPAKKIPSTTAMLQVKAILKVGRSGNWETV